LIFDFFIKAKAPKKPCSLSFFCGDDVAFMVIVVVGGAAAARVVLAASDGEDGCRTTVSA
jgi:hypothetical protein